MSSRATAGSSSSSRKPTSEAAGSPLILRGVAEHVGDGHRGQHHVHDQAQHDPVADPDVGRVGGDAGGERVDGRRHRADARAEQDHGGGDHPVVAQGQHEGYDQGVERQRLLGHALGGPAEGEQQHQDDDEGHAPTAEPAAHPGDPGVDGAGAHRHRYEDADGEHEQEDAGGAEELTGLVGADEPGLGRLDAVEAVDRRHEELVQPVVEGEVGVDLLVAARDRSPGLRVRLVHPGRHDEGQQPDGHRDDQEHRERRREPPTPCGPAASSSSVLVCVVAVLAPSWSGPPVLVGLVVPIRPSLPPARRRRRAEGPDPGSGLQPWTHVDPDVSCWTVGRRRRRRRPGGCHHDLSRRFRGRDAAPGDPAPARSRAEAPDPDQQGRPALRRGPVGEAGPSGARRLRRRAAGGRGRGAPLRRAAPGDRRPARRQEAHPRPGARRAGVRTGGHRPASQPLRRHGRRRPDRLPRRRYLQAGDPRAHRGPEVGVVRGPGPRRPRPDPTAQHALHPGHLGLDLRRGVDQLDAQEGPDARDRALRGHLPLPPPLRRRGLRDLGPGHGQRHRHDRGRRHPRDRPGRGAHRDERAHPARGCRAPGRPPVRRRGRAHHRRCQDARVPQLHAPRHGDDDGQRGHLHQVRRGSGCCPRTRSARRTPTRS